MAESADIKEKFQLNSQDLKNLKRDLLATVFNETHAKLLLFQQGKCLRTAKKNKSKNLKKPTSTSLNATSIIPADVLNDIKLDKELDSLRNIYKVAYDSLKNNQPNEENNYEDLFQAIAVQKQDNNEYDTLLNELKANKSTLKELEDELKNKNAEFSEKISQKSQRTKDLCHELNNAKRINLMEIRLVEKWENNRLSQAKVMGEINARKLMQEIQDVHQRLAGEQRLICEVETFRCNEISDLREQIKYWEEKFKVDVNEITATNLALTQNIADIVKSYEKHSEINKERVLFVAEYLQQKAEEQRLYEAQRYRIECAIRLQAWWRGVMVRKGLGPYRKKSKKGKKAKAKK